MGQKISPIGFRVGIKRDWDSNWYANKADYGKFLVEDEKVRELIDKRYNKSMPRGAVSKVEIIRTRSEMKVTLHSGRPGIVIGPRGAEVDRLKEFLEDYTGKKVNVNVVEIAVPELDAKLVAENIGAQLAKRASFRRTMKMQCENVMNAGAKGVKIICGGRLGGSELARTETQMVGSIPLHTLDANVDYGLTHARTTYGIIGVKVWIYKGFFGEEIKANPRPKKRPPRKPSKRNSKPAAKRKPAAKPAGEKKEETGKTQQSQAESKTEQAPQEKKDNSDS
jgi:small subunit ribosomal protein S3